MSLEICTSHFKEDLEWLKESPWPVSIVHHEGGTPVDYTYLIPNRGVEVTAYFKYIIERYDSLPDHVAFIHGHETSYHQLGDRPLLEMIKTANIEKYDYVPLNNAWRCVNNELQMGVELKFAREHNLLEPPQHFITCCGGQFIVSKKAILKNTREKYEHLYFITSDRSAGIYFELTWHSFFGCGPSIVPYLDHFIPKLKEVLYHTSGSIPMVGNKFRPCYIGLNCPRVLFHITNQNEYDYYEIRGATFFIDEYFYDTGNIKLDYGKLIHISLLEPIIRIAESFQSIALELSSDEHKLHF
jgi:hypothetical protein